MDNEEAAQKKLASIKCLPGRIYWNAPLREAACGLFAVRFREQSETWCKAESLEVFHFDYACSRRFQTCMEVACRFAQA